MIRTCSRCYKDKEIPARLSLCEECLTIRSDPHYGLTIDPVQLKNRIAEIGEERDEAKTKVGKMYFRGLIHGIEEVLNIWAYR